MSERRLTAASNLPRTLIICGVLTLVYYLAPVEPGATGPRLVLRAGLAVAGVALVTGLIVRLALRLSRTARAADSVVIGLAVALYAGLIAFAVLDYGWRCRGRTSSPGSPPRPTRSTSR